MSDKIKLENSTLQSMSAAAAAEICQWSYDPPFDVYNYRGVSDEYLMDQSTWGTEQFCLVDGSTILGQAACQYEGDDLWVGWSMAPALCGKGGGAAFVRKCAMELRAVKGHTGRMLLRVAAWNRRAVKAYQKAGFVYVETIRDEIAYTGHMEDFWVMEFRPGADAAAADGD